MKRKKLVAIFAALMVALSTSIPVFAAESTKMESQMDQNIPSDSIASAIQCNAKIDPTCPWTEDTQVKETIPTYDLDNQVKGFILNLSTNGNDTGYMVYDISSGEPVLAEFGYEGVYSIQGEEVTKKSELGQSKLVPVGMNEYVLQRGNDLYTIKTNTKITDKKEEIQKALEQKEANIAEYVQSEQMASTLSTRAQEIYSSVSVPNLFTNNFTPITMGEHANASGEQPSCVAIHNVNMLKYWHECRNIPSLYNSYDDTKLSQTVSRMRSQINEKREYSIYTKTWIYTASGNDGRDGISKYCKTYACTAPKETKSTSRFNWKDYKTYINNGNFMFVGAYPKSYDGSEQNHAFSGVGYQETSTGNFLRVGDQWTKHYSHFFNASVYSGDIIFLYYSQW